MVFTGMSTSPRCRSGQNHRSGMRHLE